MSTATRTIATTAPALLAGLDPLAWQVGHAVVLELREPSPLHASNASVSSSGPGISPDQMGAWRERLAGLIAQLLRQSLTAATEEGTALRLALIADLATTEALQKPSPPATPRHAPESAAPLSEILLTTEQVAQRLNVSRPYVVMLCNHGKLGEVTLTEGGHRRIRASAVQAHLDAQAQRARTVLSPREAGEAAGLYDHPDSHYARAMRGTELDQLSTKRASKKTRGTPR